MPCRIMVLYHSQGGSTLAMARAVAAGAASVPGVEVDLRLAGEAGLEHLLACSGLALGTPEYFGYMAGALKDFFDRTYEEARGRPQVFRKPYVAFVSAGNDGSGALAALERICLGYQFKKVFDPVVAQGEITPEVLAKCQELGATLAAGCQAGIY